MKSIPTLFLLALLAARPLPAQTGAWRQTEHSLARLSGTNVVWQIVADPAEGKPYFHPLATPGGTLLTDLRPADHPWHRGLWWSWKFTWPPERSFSCAIALSSPITISPEPTHRTQNRKS